jgi:hypothetical protein
MKKHNILSLAALALVMLAQPIAAFAVVGGGGNTVPEPASLSLLAIGLVAVLATRRKDRD